MTSISSAKVIVTARPGPATSRSPSNLTMPSTVDDLPDGLHPNSAGYRRMGERFAARAFTGDGPFA